MRPLRSVLVGVSILALLAGCTSSSRSQGATSTSTGSASSPSSQNTLGADMILPLDAFQSEFTSTRESVFDAEQVLMSRCMASHGFDFKATRYGQSDIFFGTYGLVDAARAAALGYTRPELDAEPDLIKIERAKVPKDPQAQRAFLLALNGEDSSVVAVKVDNSKLDGAPASVNFPTGCLGTADIQLFGTADQYARYMALSAWSQLALQSSLAQANASVDGQAALHDWSTCTADSGYAFSDVQEPFGIDWKSPRPGAAELATATKDVACKVSTNYVHRIRVAQRGFEDALIEQSANAINEFEDLRKFVISNPAAALQG